MAGERIETVETLLLQSLGGFDTVWVRVAWFSGFRGFHNLLGHQLPVEPTVADRLTGEFKLR